MKIKIMELRMRIEAWFVRHLVTIMLFSIIVVGDYWTDKIEALAEVIEDFCYGPLDMSRGTSETVTEIVLIYALVCFTNWIVRFTISRTKRLFRKPTEKKTERSA